MARRLMLALLFALAISGACTLLLAHKFARARTGASLQYVTTTKDLDAGEVIKVEDLKVISWPASNAMTGALTGVNEAVGRAVLNHLVSGQPVLAKQLSAVGGLGLAGKIPDGMRAISLKSDQVVGVAGFLMPGCHTDVLVTYRNPSSTDAVTSTVLQNAQVLAAGQKMQPDPEGKPATVDVVTLLVTPEDAEKVVLAASQGDLHFVLRNGADQQQVTPKPTDIVSLGLAPKVQPASVSRPAPKAAVHKVAKATPAAKPSPQYSIVMVRGDKQTVETFQ